MQISSEELCELLKNANSDAKELAELRERVLKLEQKSRELQDILTDFRVKQIMGAENNPEHQIIKSYPDGSEIGIRTIPKDIVIKSNANETLLSLSEIKKLVPFATSSIYKKMSLRTFPLPLKIGERKVCWKLSDIEDFLNKSSKANIKNSTDN